MGTYFADRLTWFRINPGHYVTTDPTGERFEIIRTDEGWEWTDRFTGNVTITRTLKAAKALAEDS